MFPLSEVHLTGQAQVVGDAAMMAPAKNDIDISGQATITGTLYVEPGIKIDESGKANITVKTADLSALQAMIMSQASSDTKLAATQTFDEIRKSKTITGNGKTNVIAVGGDINLSGKDSLVLSGGASDVFILNVAGEVDLSGQSSIQVNGGAMATNVYVHILGPSSQHVARCSNGPHGGDLELSGNASADGNYYVFNGHTEVTGNSSVHGSVAAMGQIQITGQGQIVGDPNCGKTTTPVCKCDGDDDDDKGWDKDKGHDRDHAVKASCDRDDDGDNHKCKCKGHGDDDDGHRHDGDDQGDDDHRGDYH